MKIFSPAPSTFLPRASIVGIFDLDTATVSGHTRNFLRRAQEAGKVVAVGDDLPQTFIVTSENHSAGALVSESAEDCIYLLPQNSANLSKKPLTIP